MPTGLKRYQRSGDLHFVTFSCYHRLAYLGSASARGLFERSLEAIRLRYQFFVSGYVVMPEHVHLLVSEPLDGTLAKALQALKLSVAVQRRERPFWQRRYYDFNVHSEQKRIEKLRYIHRNPVVRGLAAHPEDWKWSSFRHYATGLEAPWKSNLSGRRRKEAVCRTGFASAPKLNPTSLRVSSTKHVMVLNTLRDMGHPNLNRWRRDKMCATGRKGEKHGIATPLNQMAVALLDVV